MVNAVRLGIDVSAAETLIQRADLKKEEVDAEIVRLKTEEYQTVMSLTSISLLSIQVTGIDPNLLKSQSVSPSAIYNLGGRPTNETKQASAVVIEKGKKRFSR